MYIRIIVNLFIVSSWYIKESHGLEPCQSKVNIIHVCIDNKLNDLSSVYVSTGRAPLQQANECTCTISPSASSDYSLYVVNASAYHDENKNFTFAFNGVTIKNNTNFKGITGVDLTGETVLKYSSPNDDTILVCLYISALTSEDNFNMECKATQKEGTPSEPTDTATTSTISTSQTLSTGVTQTSKKDGSINTEPITSSTSNSSINTSDSGNNTETTKSTERSDMSTKPQTNNTTNKDQTILIAAAAGGGGVALIIIIVIIIVCCKRKKSPPKDCTSNEATSRADARPASFCDGSDDDDYDMVLNPAYQPFHEVLTNQPPQTTNTVETNLTTGETSTSAPVYATPLKLKASQDTANCITTTVPSNYNTKKGVTRQPGDTNNPASHYDYTIHQAAQVVTSDIDDTYDHTFTSTSGKWTGNEYNRVQMRRNEESNVLDNDTYNVLKL